MGEKFYTLFTNIGKASIANAIATQTKVNFTTLVLGDGNGSYYEPVETQEKLKNEVYRTAISNITLDDKNPNWVKIETALPGTIGGFMIREAGLLDDKGQMLVIAKYPETYKPTSDDGTIKDLLIRLIVEVANADVVNIKVDPTVILATKKDIENIEKKVNESITSEKIIEKIKQVDGSGSGLDADLLDGRDSSSFAYKTHRHNINDVDNLQNELNNRALANHNHDNLYSKLNHVHEIAQVNGLQGELDSLKQSVVNGKQTIINGIDATNGSASGLTVNNTWSDLDWWVRNKIKPVPSLQVLQLNDFVKTNVGSSDSVGNDFYTYSFDCKTKGFNNIAAWSLPAWRWYTKKRLGIVVGSLNCHLIHNYVPTNSTIEVYVSVNASSIIIKLMDINIDYFETTIKEEPLYLVCF